MKIEKRLYLYKWKENYGFHNLSLLCVVLAIFLISLSNINNLIPENATTIYVHEQSGDYLNHLLRNW